MIHRSRHDARTLECSLCNAALAVHVRGDDFIYCVGCDTKGRDGTMKLSSDYYDGAEQAEQDTLDATDTSLLLTGVGGLVSSVVVFIFVVILVHLFAGQ